MTGGASPPVFAGAAAVIPSIECIAIDFGRPEPDLKRRPVVNPTPSFVEQQRFSEALRALFRRTVFHATGAYPDEIQMEALMRTELERATQEFGSGLWAAMAAGTEAGENGGAVAADRMQEAEAAVWYAKTHGIASIPEALRWFKEQPPSKFRLQPIGGLEMTVNYAKVFKFITKDPDLSATVDLSLLPQ